MRLINADELIHLYFDDEDGNPVFDFVPWEFVENAPTIEAEPIKQTIEKFRDYQIEWLTAHNDIEFCEEEENLIIRFLKDTAECAIKFGMDEVEE